MPRLCADYRLDRAAVRRLLAGAIARALEGAAARRCPSHLWAALGPLCRGGELERHVSTAIGSVLVDLVGLFVECRRLGVGVMAACYREDGVYLVRPTLTWRHNSTVKERILREMASMRGEYRGRLVLVLGHWEGGEPPDYGLVKVLPPWRAWRWLSCGAYTYKDFLEDLRAASCDAARRADFWMGGRLASVVCRGGSEAG